MGGRPAKGERRSVKLKGAAALGGGGVGEAGAIGGVFLRGRRVRVWRAARAQQKQWTESVVGSRKFLERSKRRVCV